MALNAGTYEAQAIELYGDRGDVIRYTVSDTLTISKGTLLLISGTRTALKPTGWRGVAAGTTIPMPVAGIAAADKVALDGSTTLGVYTNGMFEMRVSQNAGLSEGDLVAISGLNNTIRKAVSADLISGAVIGRVLESGADGSELAVRVQI